MPVAELLTLMPEQCEQASHHESESQADASLLRRYFANRDHDSMDELFRRHAGMAYRVALAYVRNAADAEEIVQTAFLKILQNKPKEIANVRGWIMSIVVDSCLNKMKEEGRRRKREETAAQDRTDGASGEQSELTAAAMKAVSELPATYRLPVWLHHLEGLTFGEVGTALSLPEATVRKQAHRGIEQIRQSLTTAGFASVVSVPELLGGCALPSVPEALMSSFKSSLASHAAGGSVAATSIGVMAAGVGTKIALAAGLLLAVSAAALGTAHFRRDNDTPKAEVAEPAPVAPAPATKALTVKVDGSGDFATIQAFANAANPGDTCIVHEGTYNERVSVAKSGSEEKPITFKTSGKVVMQGFDVNNQNHIVIDGFEITNAKADLHGIMVLASTGTTLSNNHIHHTTGASRVTGAGIFFQNVRQLKIVRNNIHHTSGAGIRMRNDKVKAENITIQDNTISYTGGEPGPAAAIEVGFGNNFLIERNDISHRVGDFITTWGGDFVVIRNNVFHDVLASEWGEKEPHIDGVQGCSNHILVEGNRMYNVHVKNYHVHFALFEQDKRQGVFPENVTLRHNTINGIDSCFLAVQVGYRHARAYNNTVVRTNAGATADKNSAAVAIWQGGSGVVLNNLFYKASGSNRNLYLTDKCIAAETMLDYNLAFDGAADGAWNTIYKVPEGTDVHGIRNKDPLFRAYSDDANPQNDDLSLQDTSPAKGAGGPLTTLVSAGEKPTTLKVADAGFFQAGWAGVQADWIAVGDASNVAQISAIDYDANTITLAGALPRSVQPGSAVWLYKKSDGVRVLFGEKPDIGAVQSSGDVKR